MSSRRIRGVDGEHAIPYHLRLDAPPLGHCQRCERQTWSDEELGTECRMIQPDGFPCGGRFTNAPRNPAT